MSFSRAPITRFNETNKVSSANKPSTLQKEFNMASLQALRCQSKALSKSPICSNSTEFVKKDETMDVTKKCEPTETTVKIKHMSLGSRLTSTRARIIRDRSNRSLESQFFSKQKRFLMLRKDLLDKQKNALQLYSSMVDIRDKVLNTTGKDLGGLDDMKFLDLGQIKSLAKIEDQQKYDTQMVKFQQQSLHGGAGEVLHQNGTGGTLESSSEVISPLEMKLHHIPVVYMNLCREVVAKRNSLLVLINGLTDEDSGDGLSLEAEVRRQLIEYQQEANNFDRVMEETQQQQMQTVMELTDAIRELEEVQAQAKTNVPSAESLNEELQRKINTIMKENQMLQEQLGHLTEKLTSENDRNTVLKNDTVLLKTQVKKASQNVHDVEKKLLMAEDKIKQLIKQVEEKEGLINSSNTEKAQGELITELEKTCQTLEHRVSELLEARNQTETEATVVIMDLERQLEIANRRLNEETGLSERLNKDLEDVHERLFQVEQNIPPKKSVNTSEKGIQAEGSNSSTELDTSQREVELWTELQSTKVLLRSANSQLTTLQMEMKDLQKSVEKNNGQKETAVQKLQKLEAELEEREHDVNRLTKEANVLTTIVSFNQEQFIQYERKVSELHAKLRASRPPEDCLRQQQGHMLDLQSQIELLHTKLNEVESHSKQLEQSLVHRQLEVELRDRTIRKQTRALRTRDEQLVGIKATLENQNINVETVNIELTSKNEELQSVCSTLELKENQVHRLEKLVEQLEQNQRLQELQLHRTNRKACRVNPLSRGYGGDDSHMTIPYSNEFLKNQFPCHVKGYNTQNSYVIHNDKFLVYRHGEISDLGSCTLSSSKCQNDGQIPQNCNTFLYGMDKHRHTVSPNGDTQNNHTMRNDSLEIHENIEQPTVEVSYSTDTLDEHEVLKSREYYPSNYRQSELITSSFYSCANNPDKEIVDKNIGKGDNHIIHTDGNQLNVHYVNNTPNKAIPGVKPFIHENYDRVHLHTNSPNRCAYDFNSSPILNPNKYKNDVQLYLITKCSVLGENDTYVEPGKNQSDNQPGLHTSNCNTGHKETGTKVKSIIYSSNEQLHLHTNRSNKCEYEHMKVTVVEPNIVDESFYGTNVRGEMCEIDEQSSCTNIISMNNDQSSEYVDSVTHANEPLHVRRAWPYHSTETCLTGNAETGPVFQDKAETVESNAYKEFSTGIVQNYNNEMNVNTNINAQEKTQSDNTYRLIENNDINKQKKSNIVRIRTQVNPLCKRKMQTVIQEESDVLPNVYENSLDPQLNSGWVLSYPKHNFGTYVQCEDRQESGESDGTEHHLKEGSTMYVEEISDTSSVVYDDEMNGQQNVFDLNDVQDSLGIQKHNYILQQNPWKNTNLKTNFSLVNTDIISKSKDSIARKEIISNTKMMSHNASNFSNDRNILMGSTVSEVAQKDNTNPDQDIEIKSKIIQIIPFLTEPKSSHVGINDDENEPFISQANNTVTSKDQNKLLDINNPNKEDNWYPMCFERGDNKGQFNGNTEKQVERPSRPLHKYTVRSRHIIRDNSLLRQQLHKLKLHHLPSWPYYEAKSVKDVGRSNCKSQVLRPHLCNTGKWQSTTTNSRTCENKNVVTRHSLDESASLPLNTNHNENQSYCKPLSLNITVKNLCNSNREPKNPMQILWASQTNYVNEKSSRKLITKNVNGLSNYNVSPHNFITQESHKLSVNNNKQEKKTTQNSTKNNFINGNFVDKLKQSKSYTYVNSKPLPTRLTIQKPRVILFRKSNRQSKFQNHGSWANTTSNFINRYSLNKLQPPNIDKSSYRMPSNLSKKEPNGTFIGNNNDNIYNRQSKTPNKHSWSTKINYLLNGHSFDDLKCSRNNTPPNCRRFPFISTNKTSHLNLFSNFKGRSKNAKQYSWNMKTDRFKTGHFINTSPRFQNDTLLNYKLFPFNTTAKAPIGNFKRRVTHQKQIQRFVTEQSLNKLASVLSNVNIPSTRNGQKLKNIKDEAMLHNKFVTWLHMQRKVNGNTTGIPEKNHNFDSNYDICNNCHMSFYGQKRRKVHNCAQKFKSHFLMHQTQTDYSSCTESEPDICYPMSWYSTRNSSDTYDTDVPLSYKVSKSLSVSAQYWESWLL